MADQPMRINNMPTEMNTILNLVQGLKDYTPLKPLENELYFYWI